MALFALAFLIVFASRDASWWARVTAAVIGTTLRWVSFSFACNFLILILCRTLAFFKLAFINLYFVAHFVTFVFAFSCTFLSSPWNDACCFAFCLFTASFTFSFHFLFSFDVSATNFLRDLPICDFISVCTLVRATRAGPDNIVCARRHRVAASFWRRASSSAWWARASAFMCKDSIRFIFPCNFSNACFIVGQPVLFAGLGFGAGLLR